MGRFANGLLTAFRVVQFLLSITVLACAVYMTYEFFSLSDSAHDLQTAIDTLADPVKFRDFTEQYGTDFTDEQDQNISEVGQKLQVFDPVLKHFQETPTRAIIVSATSLWSVAVIVYLFIANRTTTKPGMNRRRIRVLLEFITLLTWLTCVVCAVLLAAEYGIVAMAGGVEAKTVFDLLKDCVKEILEKLFTDKSEKSILRSLEIIDDITTIGILAILITISASICTLVSIVSFFVACCTKGKLKQKDVSPGGESVQTFLPLSPSEKNIGYSVREIDPPISYQAVSGYARPSSYDNSPQQSVVGYHPIQNNPQSPDEHGKVRSSIQRKPTRLYGEIGHVNQPEQQSLTGYYEQLAESTHYDPHPLRSYSEQLHPSAYIQQQNQAVYPAPQGTKPLPEKPLPTTYIEQMPNTHRQQSANTYQAQPSSPYREQIPHTYQPQQNHVVYYQPPTHASHYVQQGLPTQYNQQTLSSQHNAQSATSPSEPPSLSGRQNQQPDNRHSISRKPVSYHDQQGTAGHQISSNFAGYHAR